MERVGVGQVELGHKTGITQSSISRYLRGVSEPRLSDLTRIAEFFSLSLDDLIDETKSGVLEAHDHVPKDDYEVLETAEAALEALRKLNKKQYELFRRQLVAFVRWETTKRKRKR